MSTAEPEQRPPRARTSVDKFRELEVRSAAMSLEFMRLLAAEEPVAVDDPRVTPFLELMGDLVAAGAEIGPNTGNYHASSRDDLVGMIRDWRGNLEQVLRRRLLVGPLPPYQPEKLEVWHGGEDRFREELAREARPRFEGMLFIGLNLRNVDLSAASIIDCRFEHCELAAAQFGPATTLVQTAFVDCDLRAIEAYEQRADPSADETELLPEEGGLRLASVVLERCDLRGANLDNSTFSKCVLKDIGKVGRGRAVSLQRAGFTYCRFENVALLRADAYQASFTDCSFRCVDFSLAQLGWSVFCECTLADVVFNGARLSNASFSNSDVSLADYGAMRPAPREPAIGADLRGTDFRRAFGVDASRLVAGDWSEALLPTEVRRQLTEWANARGEAPRS